MESGFGLDVVETEGWRRRRMWGRWRVLHHVSDRWNRMGLWEQVIIIPKLGRRKCNVMFIIASQVLSRAQPLGNKEG